MKFCDVTLPSPEENLAADEALLDLCEAEGGEVLRLWSPAQYFVVVGYANEVATEVNVPFCHEHGIPILRRCSGGGTVLQGPGCLNYSVILPIEESGPFRTINGTNDFVLERLRTALQGLLQQSVEKKGHTDLAINGLKICGNAQRRKRTHLIFHGCFLLDLDIALVAQALPMPSKEPDYRGARSHEAFLLNLEIPAERLAAALREAWAASEPLKAFPADRIRDLVREKYGRREWVFRD